MKRGILLKRFLQWPFLLALALFILSLVFAVHASLNRTNGNFIYALDDAYIHMAMAKNFAHHGIWGCTPFHFSSSSSSLLWTFGLGIVYFVFGVNEIAPLVLNIIFAVLTLLIADHYLEKFAASPILRAAALLGLVIAFQLPGMVLMGMEHILHLLLTIWFACAAVKALTDTAGSPPALRKQTFILCVLAALLATSRYEGFFLVGLICLGFLARRQWRRGVMVGIAAFLPTFVFGIVSLANGAFFFPNSLMVQAGDSKLSLLSVFFKLPGRNDLLILIKNKELLILVLLGLFAAAVQWAKGRRFWRPGVLLPLLLSLMTLLHIHYAFSPLFWVYRYAAYLLGFGIFSLAVMLVDYSKLKPIPGKLRAGIRELVMVAGIAALVLFAADVKNAVYPAKEIRSMTKTYFQHYTAAKFVNRYYPTDAVAINDLGAVSYFTDARILDIFGLGDIEPLQIKRNTGDYTKADVRNWTDKFHPKIGIFQLGWSFVMPHIPDEWTKIAEVKLKRPIHSGFFAMGFYAIDADAAPALKKNVKHFYGPLCSRFGYKLKVF